MSDDARYRGASERAGRRARRFTRERSVVATLTAQGDDACLRGVDEVVEITQLHGARKARHDLGWCDKTVTLPGVL